MSRPTIAPSALRMPETLTFTSTAGLRHLRLLLLEAERAPGRLAVPHRELRRRLPERHVGGDRRVDRQQGLDDGVQRSLAADPPRHHDGAVIDQDRGHRRVERFEQLLQGRRGLVVRDGQDRSIGEEPPLEPRPADPRLHNHLRVPAERHLGRVDGQVYRAGDLGRVVVALFRHASGPARSPAAGRLPGRGALRGAGLDAPAVHEVLDPRLVVDRQRHQPRLRDERHGIIALDREHVRAARRQRGVGHAGARTHQPDRREHDAQSLHDAPPRAGRRPHWQSISPKAINP